MPNNPTCPQCGSLMSPDRYEESGCSYAIWACNNMKCGYWRDRGDFK